MRIQLYNFGETVSIVMWSDEWRPDSYVDRIDRNLLQGNHTLCLLGMYIIKLDSFFSFHAEHIVTFIIDYSIGT